MYSDPVPWLHTVVVYTNKQKIPSLFLGEDTNSSGAASGRAFSIKICQIKYKEPPLVVTPCE